MPKAVRNSLVEQVYDYLKTQIKAKELMPGDRLNIEDIAKNFGVSRTPVREAINRLTQNGFVEQQHNVGPCVIQFTEEQANDLIEANAILFDYLFYELMEYGIPEHLLKELENIVHQQEKADLEKNWTRSDHFAAEFHFVLISHLKNFTIKDFLCSTQSKIDMFVSSYRTSEEYRRKSLSDHMSILAALECNNIPLAKDLMRTHNALAKESVLDDIRLQNHFND